MKHNGSKEAGDEKGVTVHCWSSTAAFRGVVTALALTIPSDSELSGPLSLLCPPSVMLGASSGNALWFMLITETARILAANLKRHFAK
jgi:hypothetical protein